MCELQLLIAWMIVLSTALVDKCSVASLNAVAWNSSDVRHLQWEFFLLPWAFASWFLRSSPWRLTCSGLSVLSTFIVGWIDRQATCVYILCRHVSNSAAAFVRFVQAAACIDVSPWVGEERVMAVIHTMLFKFVYDRLNLCCFVVC